MPEHPLRRFQTAAALAAVLLMLSGCPTADPGDDDDSAAEQHQEEAIEARLARYLTGTFDSQNQANLDWSYYPVQLVMCPVAVPDLGERVLYVEQAIMDSLDQPYRQRLYVVEPDPDDPGGAISRVWELHDPGAAVHLCDDPASLTLTAGDAFEREGCATYMTWLGDHWEGGTRAQDCASSLSGASYATSEITIDDERLESWDRGFDAAGVQVWGAVDGPYEFDRKTELEPAPEP